MKTEAFAPLMQLVDVLVCGLQELGLGCKPEPLGLQEQPPPTGKMQHCENALDPESRQE